MDKLLLANRFRNRQKAKMEQRHKFITISVFFFVILASFFIYGSVQPDEEYEQPSAAEVARLYFTAWNDKNYADMYSTLSDGFKRIEPTAKDLESFRQYVISQNIKGVTILALKETSNDGVTATVDYDVELVNADDTKTPFRGTFTLKYRKGDIIHGWKLIHPYGENVDTA